MGEIEKFIKNKAFRVHDKVTEIVPSVNGITNENMMDIYALGSIQRATMSLESFVDISSEYPEQDSTEVIFETDLMVIKTSAYKKLLDMISKLEDNTEKLNKILPLMEQMIIKKH